MFEELEARRARLDAFRPFDAGAARRLERVLKPYFIYSSNALEGSTLSLGDTIYILEEGRLPGGKREEEYLEVKGQEDAYRYLVEAATGNFHLSEKLIREFHDLLTRRLPSEKYHPGAYKPRDNRVQLEDGTVFPYVSHVETPRVMRALIEWTLTVGPTLHPVELAARVHYNFILIHPFLDGNGRTARFLANLILMQAGYVPALFRAEDRRRIYLDVLRAVDASVPYSDLQPLLPELNVFPFISYLEEELLWSFDRAIDAVSGKAGLTSEDLVRHFTDLDKAAQNPQPGDEAERVRMQESAVREMTKLVEAETQRIVAESNALMTSIEARAHSSVHPASTAFGLKAYKRFFGTPVSKLRGWVGFVDFALARRPDADPEIKVEPAEMRFAIVTEPHRLLLACQLPRDASMPYTRISMPLSQNQWRLSEIRQFIIDSISRHLQSGIVKRNV